VLNCWCLLLLPSELFYWQTTCMFHMIPAQALSQRLSSLHTTTVSLRDSSASLVQQQAAQLGPPLSPPRHSSAAGLQESHTGPALAGSASTSDLAAGPPTTSGAAQGEATGQQADAVQDTALATSGSDGRHRSYSFFPSSPASSLLPPAKPPTYMLGYVVMAPAGGKGRARSAGSKLMSDSAAELSPVRQIPAIGAASPPTRQTPSPSSPSVLASTLPQQHAQGSSPVARDAYTEASNTAEVQVATRSSTSQAGSTAQQVVADLEVTLARLRALSPDPMRPSLGAGRSKAHSHSCGVCDSPAGSHSSSPSLSRVEQDVGHNRSRSSSASPTGLDQPHRSGSSSHLHKCVSQDRLSSKAASPTHHTCSADPECTTSSPHSPHSPPLAFSLGPTAVTSTPYVLRPSRRETQPDEHVDDKDQVAAGKVVPHNNVQAGRSVVERTISSTVTESTAPAGSSAPIPWPSLTPAQLMAAVQAAPVTHVLPCGDGEVQLELRPPGSAKKLAIAAMQVRSLVMFCSLVPWGCQG
jgi:hypothetical protein